MGFPRGPPRETPHSPLMLGFCCLSWGSSGNDRDGVGRQAPRIALPFIEASPTHPNYNSNEVGEAPGHSCSACKRFTYNIPGHPMEGHHAYARRAWEEERR